MRKLSSNGATNRRSILTTPIRKAWHRCLIPGTVISPRSVVRRSWDSAVLARMRGWRGGHYSETALDVGAGLRPDLTGCGAGRSFVAAIVAFAGQYALGRPLRATVAGFNVRSIRTVESVGFAEVGRFRRPTDSMEFVMLQRNGTMAHKRP